MRPHRTHPPQGALGEPDGSVVWRVWAPLSSAVSLVSFPSGERRETAMTPEDRGYFSHRRAGVAEGFRYAYQLADGREYPDPASRWQPDGVHRPSAVFFPGAYRWSDAAWRGAARHELVIYELHAGTFTPQGTLEGIIPRLTELRELGVTAVELMPLAQFAGERNWGYDGVYPYAVAQSYGGPRALQRSVDAAHQAGLAVILDVVYNHLGPEGNYLANFGPYFTDRYRTPWGQAVNYDGPESDAVRAFVLHNVRMWVRDFHLDGLRLDAVHSIYDLGARHILAEIQAAAQREAARAGRQVHVIAESNQNDVRLIRPHRRGGYGLDGVWSDDFHHAVHALLTGERDGYYLDFGGPREVAKALSRVFVYDGCYSRFRRRRHGSRVGATDRTRFVVCIQNHDQVGNRARGDRLSTLVDGAAQRLACGLLLLGPCVPLLFMGEEYGERRPFPFFCSFADAAVVEGVRRGRRREFADLAFRWGSEIPDPLDPETFAAAQLTWSWPEGSPQSQLRRLYQDLLAIRRRCGALADRQQATVRLLVRRSGRRVGRTSRSNGGSSVAAGRLVRPTSNARPRPTLQPRPTPERGAAEPALLLLRRGGQAGLLAVANLSTEPLRLAGAEPDGRRLLLSTEDARYGGSRTPVHFSEETLPPPLPVPVSPRPRVPASSRSGLARAHGREDILPHEILVFAAAGGPP
jgi:maltooligosyltrehalose trehalohydrolase